MIVLTIRKSKLSVKSMKSDADFVSFTSKGQVVIPNWLRKQFGIEEGTRALVQATSEGILLTPVTSAFVRKGRGILKNPATISGGAHGS